MGFVIIKQVTAREAQENQVTQDEVQRPWGRGLKESVQNVDQDIYGRDICLLLYIIPRYAVRDVNKRTLRKLGKGKFINDVPCFLAIFDLPTLSYSTTSLFWGYFGPPYLP